VGILRIEQKKGDPAKPDGRLTVFARINSEGIDSEFSHHPIASMVNNGLLVAQGNYRDQNNLRDFLKSEMGVSLEDGLSEFLERLDGIEGALDPDKLKDKLENLDDLQEFIPTPAKIVPFRSEDEVLGCEGDVYFVGHFKNVANANLSVNAFPILYQARFREYQFEKVRTEIENLVSMVENQEIMSIPKKNENVKDKILKEFIPDLLYCKKEDDSFEKACTSFRHFLLNYQFKEDVEEIITLIHDNKTLNEKHNKLLTLFAQKIECVLNEKFNDADEIKRNILEVKSELS